MIAERACLHGQGAAGHYDGSALAVGTARHGCRGPVDVARRPLGHARRFAQRRSGGADLFPDRLRLEPRRRGVRRGRPVSGRAFSVFAERRLGPAALVRRLARRLLDPSAGSVFAACGGASSLEEFRTLYGWERLRRGSVLLLGTASLIGLAGAGAWPRYRFALPRLLGLCLIGLALALGRVLVGFAVANVDDLARFNVGQYRHAVDLTFASLAVGAVLASVVAPPLPAGAVRRLWPSGSAVLWLFVLLLDICFGALFLARDAATAWTGWPGIADFP